MRIAILLISLIFCSHYVSAQDATLQGRITDSLTEEGLIGAQIKIGDTGTITDFDGNYTLPINKGTYEVVVSYLGYDRMVKTVDINESVVVLDFPMQGTVLKEIKVVADVARSRETPVAFSTVPLQKIQETLSVQDLPMVLNSTPGVYATQQGGGDGDARITIRGFNQRNIAIMIDGIPVNDMENGWVYWSNWSGLSNVARSMQVQRGLGASKLALPSIGGTINLLTKGIESKRKFKIQQSLGSNGFLRSTISGTSGRLDNGFGVTFVASYRQQDGWVDRTWSQSLFYFLKLEKSMGKHTLGISAVGAPQSHGQRSFKKVITTFDKDYAANLFDGSSEEYTSLANNVEVLEDLQLAVANDQITTDELSAELNGMGISQDLYDRFDQTFIDTSGVAGDFGIAYNPHWGNLQEWKVENGDTIFQEAGIQDERVNYYHKPQFTLRHFFAPNTRFSLSNMAYLSLGNGGGTSNEGSGGFGIDENGQITYQTVYDANSNPLFWDGVSPRQATSFLRTSENNHVWMGLLSTFDYSLNDQLDLSGGIDLRNYKGIHQRRVENLLGGDFAGSVNDPRYVGDIFDRDYIGYVQWGGLFGQLEYKTPSVSSFINLTTAMTGVQREDLFQPDSLQLTEVVWIPGFTAKAGANWNFSERQNIFFNTGFLSKAPPFNNVFSFDNTKFPNVTNEKISAFELGYGYKAGRFAINANSYYTIWNNRPLLVTVLVEDQSERRNAAGVRAHHRGVEFDFACELIPKKLKWEGLLSWGDWIWKTDSTTILYGSTELQLNDTPFSANGVHVGDAAQFQIGSSFRYSPIKNLYGTIKATYFGKNFSDFSPEDLVGKYADQESWRIPDYYLVDFHAGYRFNLNKLRWKLGLNVLNLLDEVYISDASTRGGFAPDQIEVFFGTGRRWSLSLGVEF